MPPKFLSVMASFALCTSSSYAAGFKAADANHFAKPTPAYLSENNGCAILVGGNVSDQFEDPKVANFWHTLSASITELLYETLQQDQYRVIKLILTPEENPGFRNLTMNAMAKHECSRILQISNIVNQDEQGAYFRYDVSLMQAQPDAKIVSDGSGISVTMNSNYSRSYRYARTPEIFKSFQFDEFSQTVYTDMKASAALQALHRSSPAVSQREYQVSHILLTSEAEAQRAALRLQNGQAFDKVASDMSQDVGTKADGGRIKSWTRAKDFSVNFRREVLRLNVNQVSTTPVKTEFGWHLLRLDGVR